MPPMQGQRFPPIGCRLRKERMEKLRKGIHFSTRLFFAVCTHCSDQSVNRLCVDPCVRAANSTRSTIAGESLQLWAGGLFAPRSKSSLVLLSGAAWPEATGNELRGTRATRPLVETP